MYVDLNCDMGESFGHYQLGNDEEMMALISSANIACGFHAGDPHVMRKTVQLARQHDVSIGAHPGFPDRMGFGRRYMTCSAEEIRDYILYQTGALREFARAYQLDLDHCKPHGALYMMAMADENIARAFLEGLAMLDEKMIVYALNGSAVAWLGEKMGIPIALEVYADRDHTEDGSIVLTRSGPTISDPQTMANRVVRMVKEGKVTTPDGKEATVRADTICIHGDTPGAVELTKAIHQAFREAGIEVRSVKNSTTHSG